MKDQRTIDFVNKVREVIGPTYDLSHVVYEHSLRRVHVVCPKHGDLYPVASELQRGRVCKSCGVESRRRTLSSFKEEVSTLYAGKYNYDHLVQPKNNREKFSLFCPEHGEFTMNMLRHIQGQACPKCGIARRANASKLPQAEAIAQLENTKIGDYDFSEYVYTGGQRKSWVTCRKHDHKFAMTYANLTQGHGCPKCGKEISDAGATARGIAGMRSMAGAKWTVATPEGTAKAGSSWEVLVYRWLITKYPNTKTQLYIKTHLGGYMPDFYIPEKNLYLEVKGREITTGQAEKRATINNLVTIRAQDMLTIFAPSWYTPPAWGRGLGQTARNLKLNTADLGDLPDVDTWLKSKGF